MSVQDMRTPEARAAYYEQCWKLAADAGNQAREELAEVRKVCNKLRDMLVRETATQKHKHELWMRLCFDMLSVYREGQDFNITQERVECWREEWNNLTGINYAEF